MNYLILGGSGFIGTHMARRLATEGHNVLRVDLKPSEYKVPNTSFVLGDLRNKSVVNDMFYYFEPDFVYQFAADMGGAGFVFTGENDANIMHNSAQINLNVLDVMSTLKKKPRIFYSSSACMYPEHNQLDADNPNCEESSAYPANPDSEYGWEKLFSERLFFAYAKNYDIDVRVARYHNIYGPMGTWTGGREKSPAAICRKVIQADSSIEIWGDGNQTRSFLYIDDCIDATRALMNSDFRGPVNIGSEEMVSINDLVDITTSFENKSLEKIHIDGPTGVRGRNSHNALIKQKLGWEPKISLNEGMKRTYFWIKEQIERKK